MNKDQIFLQILNDRGIISRIDTLEKNEKTLINEMNQTDKITTDVKSIHSDKQKKLLKNVNYYSFNVKPD